MGAGTDTDQNEDAKLGAQAPLVSEVTRRYKVRLPPAQRIAHMVMEQGASAYRVTLAGPL